MLEQTSQPTAQELISEHFQLQDELKNLEKTFAEFCAGRKARLKEISDKLLEMLNALGGDGKANLSTDAGTAYLSHIMSVSIDMDGAPYEGERGRNAFIDFCNAHWDEIGNELMMVQPQKDAVKRWMEDKGQAPPGVKTAWLTRVNIRRS